MQEWRTKRMEAEVKRLNKDLDNITTLIERNNIMQKNIDGLERIYKLQRKGLSVTREGIKDKVEMNDEKREHKKPHTSEKETRHKIEWWIYNNRNKYMRKFYTEVLFDKNIQ